MKINYKVRQLSFKLLAAYVAIASISAVATVVTYQIKKGDNLTKILRAHGLKPLHGKNGFIKLTTKLNKDKITKKGNFIRIGEMIELPISEEIENKIATIRPAEESAPLKKQEIDKEIIKASRAPSDDFPYSRFVYSPHLSFLKIDATNDLKFGGSNVTALSKKGLGVDLAWHLFYDERFSFFGFGSLDYFSFYNDPNYSFNNSSMTRLHFGVGGIFDYSPELKFKSKISLREVTFLDVITPTVINLESISVPEIEVGFEKTLFTKKKLAGIWGANFMALAPSSRGSYKSKLGYGVGTSFEVIHKNKSLFLKYDLRSLQVNEIKNKESTIVLGINFFGENDL